MSQENVELVRRAYEAWNRGDIDAVVQFAAPDGEYRPASLAVIPPGMDAVYFGRDGFARFARDFVDLWDEFSIEPEHVIDRGDKVVALVRLRGVGRGGVSVEAPLAHVITLRDGLCVRLDSYPDRQKAFKAIGLSE
jgi:ketosteroid isomerase-like protein